MTPFEGDTQISDLSFNINVNKMDFIGQTVTGIKSRDSGIVGAISPTTDFASIFVGCTYNLNDGSSPWISKLLITNIDLSYRVNIAFEYMDGVN